MAIIAKHREKRKDKKKKKRNTPSIDLLRTGKRSVPNLGVKLPSNYDLLCYVSFYFSGDPIVTLLGNTTQQEIHESSKDQATASR